MEFFFRKELYKFIDKVHQFEIAVTRLKMSKNKNVFKKFRMCFTFLFSFALKLIKNGTKFDTGDVIF